MCIEIADLNRAKWADQWFQILETTVHREINSNRKDGQKSVRVAILDTGIDATHPEIRVALEEKRIAGQRGFPDSLDPLCDRHGHGTHGISVLMKTAPNAIIYVARVADNDGNLSEGREYINIREARSLRITG